MLLLSLVVISSCTKSSNPGGSWTFKSTTYDATSCSAGSGELYVTNSTASNSATFSSLSIYFYNNVTPTANGTYYVNRHPASADQINILLSIVGGTTNYTCTGGNGTQTVSVTVSNNKLSVSGSGITLSNDQNASDSSALNFNITQLQ
jgi:hypothetical protein